MHYTDGVFDCLLCNEAGFVQSWKCTELWKRRRTFLGWPYVSLETSLPVKDFVFWNTHTQWKSNRYSETHKVESNRHSEKYTNWELNRFTETYTNWELNRYSVTHTQSENQTGILKHTQSGNQTGILKHTQTGNQTGILKQIQTGNQTGFLKHKVGIKQVFWNIHKVGIKQISDTFQTDKFHRNMQLLGIHTALKPGTKTSQSNIVSLT